MTKDVTILHSSIVMSALDILSLLRPNLSCPNPNRSCKKDASYRKISFSVAISYGGRWPPSILRMQGNGSSRRFAPQDDRVEFQFQRHDQCGSERKPLSSRGAKRRGDPFPPMRSIVSRSDNFAPLNDNLHSFHNSISRTQRICKEI